jgi:hypothetical protein
MAVYIECINTLKQRLAAVDTAIVAMRHLQAHYQKVGYPASPGAPFDAKGEHGPGAMDVNVCLVCGSEEGERHSLKCPIGGFGTEVVGP